MFAKAMIDIAALAALVSNIGCVHHQNASVHVQVCTIPDGSASGSCLVLQKQRVQMDTSKGSRFH